MPLFINYISSNGVVNIEVRYPPLLTYYVFQLKVYKLVYVRVLPKLRHTEVSQHNQFAKPLLGDASFL